MRIRAYLGFTLLELIVVIVVLGILSSIAIPSYATIIGKSRIASLKETARVTAANAVALAAFENRTPLTKSVSTVPAAELQEQNTRVKYYLTAQMESWSADNSLSFNPELSAMSAASGTPSSCFTISKDGLIVTAFLPSTPGGRVVVQEGSKC